jgi:hypothetical protein
MVIFGVGILEGGGLVVVCCGIEGSFVGGGSCC